MTDFGNKLVINGSQITLNGIELKSVRDWSLGADVFGAGAVLTISLIVDLDEMQIGAKTE